MPQPRGPIILGDHPIFHILHRAKKVARLIDRFLEFSALPTALVPGTPVSGRGYLYLKDDKKLYFKDEDGTEVNLGVSGAVTAVEAEATLDLAGDVTIDGAKSLLVDVINEKDAGAGVTIDSVLLKDGVVAVGDVAFDDATSDPLADAAAASDGSENSVSRKDHVHPQTGANFGPADATSFTVVNGLVTAIS